jgi:hypothetical protein
VRPTRVLLRRYLERRFGVIPPALEERIATSDAEELTALFERALVATALEELGAHIHGLAGYWPHDENTVAGQPYCPISPAIQRM